MTFTLGHLFFEALNSVPERLDVGLQPEAVTQVVGENGFEIFTSNPFQQFLPSFARTAAPSGKTDVCDRQKQHCGN